jgi:hypothetical protein
MGKAIHRQDGKGRHLLLHHGRDDGTWHLLHYRYVLFNILRGES